MKAAHTSPDSIAEILRKNIFIAALFIVSTLFFIYQHSRGTAWDFAAYALNARHMFFGAPYFEWYRPPLAPFLLGIFGFAGRAASEYLYIIFVSALFLYAVLQFSKAAQTGAPLMYALLLGPFTIIHGMLAGTELLSLSLLMLFAASLMKKEPRGAIFLSLAALARYPNAAFLPLVLFYREPRKIASAAFLFFLPFIPWLAYNYFEAGSAFTSIADAYALNISYKDYAWQPLNAGSILIALNYLIPLSVAGAAAMLKAQKRREYSGGAIMLAFAAIAAYSAWTIPVKDIRYLFNLMLPLAWLSYFAAARIKKSGMYLAGIFAVFVFAASLFYLSPAFVKNPKDYASAAAFADDCAISSNGWVYLNYEGVPAESAPWQEMLDSRIKSGYRLIFFSDLPDPDYAKNITLLRSFPQIKEAGRYVVLGDKSKCAPRTANLAATYLEKRKEFLLATRNYTEESAPCRVLFGGVADEVCGVMRYGEFKHF